MRRRIVAFLDAVAFVLFALQIVIMLTGGWSGSFRGLPISAEGPEHLALLLGPVLLIRRITDLRTPWGQVPLVQLILRWLGRVENGLERRTYWGLAGLILAYALLMGAVACRRHATYQSRAYDLGLFAQMFWAAAHGHGLISSILGRHFLGEHFSPILYLFVPLYRLFPRPETLILLQTLALAMAAVPLFLLARSVLQSRAWGVFFAFLYLSYQPVRNVNVFDFHEIALATPLLLWAYLFLYQSRIGLFVAALTAALFCKEEVALIAAGFGVFVILRNHRSPLGYALVGGGALACYLILYHVIPTFRGSEYGFVHRYSYLGDSVGEVIGNLIRRPFYAARHAISGEKMKYVLEIYGPLAFLPFVSPAHMLLTLPTLVQNLLSDFPPQYSIEFQYTSALTPFVFVAGVFGAKRWLALRRPTGGNSAKSLKLADSPLSALLLLCAIAFYGKSPIWFLRKYRSPPHRDAIVRLMREIPDTAPVSVQEPYVAHLTSRPGLYQFPMVSDAEYVFLDSAARKWPPSDEEYFAEAELLLRRGFRVKASLESVLVLEKGPPRTAAERCLPAAFLQSSPKRDDPGQK